VIIDEVWGLGSCWGGIILSVCDDEENTLLCLDLLTKGNFGDADPVCHYR